jgi:hypothetical protein
VQILPQIPQGLERKDMLRQLATSIEDASRRLAGEGMNQ